MGHCIVFLNVNEINVRKVRERGVTITARRFRQRVPTSTDLGVSHPLPRHHSTPNPPHCSLIHQPIPSLIPIDGCHRFLCFLMEYPTDNGKLTSFCLWKSFVSLVRLLSALTSRVAVKCSALYVLSIQFRFERLGLKDYGNDKHRLITTPL